MPHRFDGKLMLSPQSPLSAGKHSVKNWSKDMDSFFLTTLKDAIFSSLSTLKVAICDRESSRLQVCIIMFSYRYTQWRISQLPPSNPPHDMFHDMFVYRSGLGIVDFNFNPVPARKP